MSKMSELAAGLDELKHAGEILISFAETMKDYFSGEEDPQMELIPEEVKAAEPEKEISFIDVRKLLTEKSRSGKTDDVKALLKKYGADKLSEIKPEDYAALIKEAEEL